MLTLVIGKSKSGKSVYAESLLEKVSGVPKKYYIATMKVCDDKSAGRKKHHIAQREGKGFVTIEQFTDIAEAADMMEEGSAALLECMTNLVANEMFDGGASTADELKAKVIPEVMALYEKLRHLVIVSGDFSEFEDKYDESTKRYIEALTMINGLLSERADEVAEVVDGVPKILKKA